MISYSPRRCLSSSDSDQKPILRVPSDDDPKAFHFIPRVSAATMLRRTSSAQASTISSFSRGGGGLPVYSSSTPRQAGRERSFTSSYNLKSSYGGPRSPLSSLFTSSASSRYSYPYDDDEDDKYSKSTTTSRTNILAIMTIITTLFYAYVIYRTSSISTQLSALNLDLRTTLFDHNNDAMALAEAQALEKELLGEIDYHNKEIARKTLAKTMSEKQNEMLLKKEEGLKKRMERMERDIADISRMEAIER